jgi:PKD repeat protein
MKQHQPFLAGGGNFLLPQRLLNVPFGRVRILTKYTLTTMLFCLLFTARRAAAQSPCAFTWTAGSGTDIQFHNSYTGGNIIYETWTFGDNNFAHDVSDPRHTYYYYCSPPQTRTYTVTHTVTVLLESGPQTFSCSEVVSVTCDEGSACSERFFYYDVRGCAVTFNATIYDPTSGVTIIWDFGDGTPPVNNPVPTHSYAQPGTYLVTQTYTFQGNSGTCSRWVTVGCCCAPFADFSADLELDCAALRIHADKGCVQPGRYSNWTLQIGNQTPVSIPDSGIDGWQLTNYSTYQNQPVTLTHRVWCDSQEVVVTKTLTPPVPGIFIGVAGDGTTCLPPTTNISAYSAVLGANNTLFGNVHLYVSGIIRLDESFSLNNGPTAHMGPAAGFDVPDLPAVSLQIANGSSIVGTDCCLWRGIYVFGRGTFRSNTTNVLPVNRIEDAMYAVRAFNVNGNQPQIFLTRTELRNNMVGLRGTDGAFNLRSSPLPFPIFEGNRFTSDPPLQCLGCLETEEDILPALGLPYSTARGLAGFWLQGNPGTPNALTNMLIRPANDGVQNEFDNLAIGIEARDFNLSLQDAAAFRNITAASPYGFGHGINYLDRTGAFALNVKGLVANGTPTLNGNTFENCQIGVRAEARAVPATTVNIEDCQMRNMRQGIFLDGFAGNIRGATQRNDIEASQNGITLVDMLPAGARQYRITDNLLTAGPGTGFFTSNISITGSALNQTSFVEVDHNDCAESGSFGILANAHQNAYIHDNIVTANGTLQGIAAYVGQYEIECNTVTGATGMGLNVWNSAIRNDLSFNTVTGAAEGIRFTLDCPGQNFIECNTVQNTTGRGLFYDDARTDNQFNTGNRWINTGGAEFVQGMNQPGQSEYFVPDLVPWRPMPVDPPQGWFFPNMALIPPPCNVVCQPGLLPPGGGADNPFDTDIAGGGPAGEGWDQWRRERYLLYKLAAYPELAPAGSLMANFQNARATSTVGKLVGIGLQSAGLFAPAPADQAVLEANQQAIATKSEQMAAIDAQLDEALAPEVYAALLTQREVLNTDVATLAAQSNALQAQLQTARNTEADNLLAQLANINTTEVWEQNEKQVLTVFLQTVAQAQAPDAGQLATLQAVGEQCPRTGGPAAVFLAAMLYEGFTGERLEQDECGAAARSNSTFPAAFAAKAVFSVSAFPNPVHDRLILDVTGGQQPYTVQVSDMLGKVLVLQQYFEEQPVLNTGIWAEGMYHLLVRDADGAPFTRTIFVKH